MKKNLFYILVVLAALLCPQMLWALDNTSCEKATVLKNKEVTVNIPEAGDYWYKASTFDLPIHVHFVPNDKNLNVAPIAYVDFSCTTGVYDDQKLDSVIKYGKEMDKNLPYELPATAHRDDELGQIVYDLNVGRKYRDQLSSMGISYEVTAYVKVHVECGGGVTITPDTVGVKCKESCAWLHEPDTTIEVSAGDEETAYVLPLVDWKNDSVQFIWQGTNEPVSIWFGSDDCAFEPKTNGKYVLSDRHYVIEPNSELKLTTDSIDRLVNTILARGGVYYVKFVSSETANLIIQRVPEKGADGDAKLLKYTVAESLTPEKDTLYYYFKSWKATRFETNTSAEVTMYVGATADLNTADASTQIAAFAMSLGEDGKRYLALSDADMKALSDKAAKGSNCLYVRFRTEETATVTPQKWTDASPCEGKTYLLQEGVPVSINANDNGKTMYRMRFSEWEGYKMVIKRTEGSNTLTVYIGDTCKYTQSKNSNTMHDNNKMNARVYELGPNAKKELSSSDLSNWNSSLKDGYFYVTFKCGMRSTVIFTREEQPITKITLSTDKGGTTLNADTTSLSLIATILPKEVANKPLKWTVSDPLKLVEWDEATKTLTAKPDAETGDVTVTAEAQDGSGKKAEITIHVFFEHKDPVVESIVLSTVEGGTTLNKDTMSLTLSATILPAELADAPLTWTVTDPLELVVWNEATKTLTAKPDAEQGDVTVTAEAQDGSGVTAEITIHVYFEHIVPVVTSIALTTVEGGTTLSVDKPMLTIVATIKPDELADTPLIWTLLDPNGLVVWDETTKTIRAVSDDKSGLVVLQVQADDEGQYQTQITITVVARPIINVEKLVLSSDITSLTKATPIAHLSLKVQPEDADDKTVSWTLAKGKDLVDFNEEDTTVTMRTNTAGGEVWIEAIAKDLSKIHSNVVVLKVENTKLSEQVKISGPVSLTRQNPSATYSASVLPAATVDKSVTWSILSGDTLVTMDTQNARGECVLTLIMNMNGGKVVLVATANDGSEAADTLTITVDAVPVWVETLQLSTEEGVTEMTENQPSLHLVAKALPEDAKDQTVEWSIVEGAELVALEDNVVTVRSGFMAGEVVVRATAQDEGGATATLRLTTASIRAALQRIILDTYEQIYVLDDFMPTLHVRVEYVPENPSSRDIRLEVKKGEALIQSIRRYEAGMGFVVERATNGASGSVLLRASSYDNATLNDELELMVIGAKTEDVRMTSTDAPRYRKVLRDGMLYIEVLTDKGVVEYNVLGCKK